MSKLKTTNPGSQQQEASQLKEVVKYYERMHKDARLALDIAGRMSLEMKEQLIKARQKLELAKSANNQAELLDTDSLAVAPNESSSATASAAVVERKGDNE